MNPRGGFAKWLHRGDDTIKLYLWMDRLRDQARAAGGDVLSHLGNHEWMNAIGMSAPEESLD